MARLPDAEVLKNPPPKLISFKSPSERDAAILERYKTGLRLKDIAEEFKLSEVRISQILKKHRNLVAIDREYERQRRLNALKHLEARAPKTLAPENAREFVAVIEAQRKELEEQGPQVVNNTLVVNADLDKLPASEKWDKIRGLLGE